jgi:hypothetical protein
MFGIHEPEDTVLVTRRNVLNHDSLAALRGLVEHDRVD